MNLTVDTSVAVKWVVAEPGHERARSFLPYLRDETVVYNHVLSAPALIRLESYNVLAKRAVKGLISVSQFTNAAHYALDEVDISPVDDLLAERARDISLGARAALSPKGHATEEAPFRPFNIYDCIFIAHAMMHRQTLLTADKDQATVARWLNLPVEFVTAE